MGITDFWMLWGGLPMLLGARGAIPVRFRSVCWHPAPVLFYTSDSDARSQIMTQGTVQLVAGILAVVLVAIVILRRKGAKKKKDEDDF